MLWKMPIGRLRLNFLILKIIILHTFLPQAFTSDGDVNHTVSTTEAASNTPPEVQPMDIDPHERFKRSENLCNSGPIISLDPHQKCTATYEDNVFESIDRSTTIVQNLGISTIHAIYCYGNFLRWYECPAEQHTIRSGSNHTFTDTEKRTASGVIVENMNSSRALFYVAYVPVFSISNKQISHSRYYKFHKNGVKLLLDISMNGNLDNPGKSYTYLVDIVDTFWPHTAMDNWQEMLQFIPRQNYGNEITKIENVLETFMTPLEYGLKTIVKGGPGCQCAKADFEKIMNILSRLDLKIIFEDKNELNHLTLPIYSHIVNILMTINTFLIYNHVEYFAKENIINLKNARKEMYLFAEKYIKHLESSVLKFQYEHGNVETMYNELMNERTYIAVNGLEYLPFWKFVCSENEKQVQNTYLAYSEAFGTIGLEMNKYLLYVNPDLQPEILSLNGKVRRKRIFAIDFSFHGDDNNLAIVQVIYEKSYDLKSLSSKALRLHGKTIKSMEVGGSETVEYITFTLSNNSTYTVSGHHSGPTPSKPFKVFELLHHHIAGIFADSFNNIIRSISVSYELDDILSK